MTDPNYSVPPNPALAAALQSIKVAPKWTNTVDFRDFVLQTAQNGVGPDLPAIGKHQDDLISKLTFAFLESLQLINAVEQVIPQLEARIKALEQRR